MAQPELICRKLLELRSLQRGYEALKHREPGDNSEETPATLLALEIGAEIHMRMLAEQAEAEAE